MAGAALVEEAREEAEVEEAEAEVVAEVVAEAGPRAPRKNPSGSRRRIRSSSNVSHRRRISDGKFQTLSLTSGDSMSRGSPPERRRGGQGRNDTGGDGRGPAQEEEDQPLELKRPVELPPMQHGGMYQ